jgi:hypothetical protein
VQWNVWPVGLTHSSILPKSFGILNAGLGHPLSVHSFHKEVMLILIVLVCRIQVCICDGSSPPSLKLLRIKLMSFVSLARCQLKEARFLGCRFKIQGLRFLLVCPAAMYLIGGNIDNLLLLRNFSQSNAD